MNEVVEYQETINRIDQLSLLPSKDAIANQANSLTSSGLVHLQWNQVDPEVYNLKIPIWENYVLYLLNLFTDIEQFERYHFADYKKNLERGVGICGDASTILSSILDKNHIKNEIITFDGHVIVQYENDQEERKLLDPDFGIQMDFDIHELYAKPSSIRKVYEEAGYSEREIKTLEKVYKRGFLVFDDTFHFMTKRYIFEIFFIYFKMASAFCFVCNWLRFTYHEKGEN